MYEFDVRFVSNFVENVWGLIVIIRNSQIAKACDVLQRCQRQSGIFPYRELGVKVDRAVVPASKP